MICKKNSGSIGLKVAGASAPASPVENVFYSTAPASAEDAGLHNEMEADL